MDIGSPNAVYRRRKHFLESKQTEAKPGGENGIWFSCDVCDFSGTSRKFLNNHMISQQRDLEQVDGNISLNSANVDAHEQEKPTEPTLAEDVLTLKFDLEYWTWPGNKAPPSKVHHQHKGLGTSANLYTDALGFDHISYNFKNGVHNVFEIIYFFYLLMWAKGVP